MQKPELELVTVKVGVICIRHGLSQFDPKASFDLGTRMAIM
jgi:hypothetical protein